MSGSTESTELLRSALRATGGIVDGIQASQWTAPTPCSEWDVRQVLLHLIEGNRRLARVVRAEPSTGESADAGADSVGGAASVDAVAGDAADPAAAFHATAERLVDAFSQPDALGRIVTVPFGTVPATVALDLRLTENVVHGWDLARATGQQASFPSELIDRALAFTAGALSQLPPDRTPFAPPQPSAAGAPPIDRLVALLGRSA